MLALDRKTSGRGGGGRAGDGKREEGGGGVSACTFKVRLRRPGMACRRASGSISAYRQTLRTTLAECRFEMYSDWGGNTV